MRQLSDTLLAAQKKPDRVPYVEAKTYSNLLQGVKRLEWTRLYTGSEADNHHGMAFDGQGSMHRIRVAGSNIFRQKIADPGPTSDYSTWTQIATNCAGPCAIAANGARVYIFYKTTTNVIWKYYSHDYGATWNNAQVSTWANVLYMSASWFGTGSNVICFALRIPPGTHGLTDYCINAIVLDTQTQTASEYPDCSPINHDLQNVYGIGSTYNTTDGVCEVIFAAYQAEATQDFYALYRTEFSPLPPMSGWLGWSYFHMQFPDDDLWMTYPEVHRPAAPQTCETSYLLAVEHFVASGAHDRPLLGHLAKGTQFTDATYKELSPFANLDTVHGLRMQSTTSYFWLECPAGLWRAPRTAPTEIDLSPDILSLRQVVASEAKQQPALSITLDNSRAIYATPPPKGSEVVLKLGYKTSAGNEASDAGHYWITGWEYASAKGNSTLTLRCQDLWQLAHDWTARYVIRFNYNPVNPMTIAQCLANVLARSGVRLWNNPGAPRSYNLDNFYPKFYIRASAHGDTELNSLLNLCTDVLVPREGYCYAKDLRADEAPCYQYSISPGTHGILGGSYSEDVLITHVQVSGETNDIPAARVMASAFDWPSILLGIDNLDMHYDPNLEATSIAQRRADAYLRKASLRAQRGNLIVPTNCGQELFDVVEVTDPRTATAATYRITAIQTDYDPADATYVQRLELSAR